MFDVTLGSLDSGLKGLLDLGSPNDENLTWWGFALITKFNMDDSMIHSQHLPMSNSKQVKLST